MAQTNSRSLQQIKYETELTRAGLTDTVDQLRSTITDTASDVRERMKPDAIKAEVSSYFRSRGEQLLSDVTDAARRNPMQAVAVGASVAYPLFRIARSIPLPVLMVGAGLYLAGSKTGQSFTNRAGEMVSDQLDRLSATVSGGADQVGEAVNSAGAAVGTATEQLQERARSSAGSISDATGELKDQGLRMADSAATALQDFAARAASAARNAVGATADAGVDAARAVRDKTTGLAQHTSYTVRETIEQNPLAVAGLGLLIGALIASALPRTEVEDQVIGETTTAMKRRAQEAASQATRVATEAYEDLGERVRHVAEKAVTTAFEPGQDQNQQQDETQRRFTE